MDLSCSQLITEKKRKERWGISSAMPERGNKCRKIEPECASDPVQAPCVRGPVCAAPCEWEAPCE